MTSVESVALCVAGVFKFNDRGGGDKINEIIIRNYDFRNKVQYEILENRKICFN